MEDLLCGHRGRYNRFRYSKGGLGVTLKSLGRYKQSANCPIAIKSARMYDDGTARGNEFVLIRGGKMFFKCLDCGSVILDPNLNTSQCPICGSVNFVVEEEQVAGATPYLLDSPVQAAENEKLTALKLVRSPS